MAITIATTDQQYYENSETWGNANVISLENFIDNLILKSDDDDYFKHFKKHSLSIIAKQGIKRFNVDVNPRFKAIVFQLGSELIFPHPRFMRSWVRISVVNECGKLTTLAVNPNNRTRVVQDYLQDQDHELLYDQDGEVLRGDDENFERGDCNQVEFTTCSDNDCGCENVDCCDTASGKYADSYVIDSREGSYFEFSSDLYDLQIVIEYRTTGLDTMNDCDIPVHNDMEMLLEYWCKWQFLIGRKNANNNTKLYYHSLYKNEKTRSKMLMGESMTINDIVKAVNLR